MSDKLNVGLIDRLLRLAISVILFYLAFYYPAIASDPVFTYTLVPIGLINALVSVIGICPVYLLIGISTRK